MKHLIFVIILTFCGPLYLSLILFGGIDNAVQPNVNSETQVPENSSNSNFDNVKLGDLVISEDIDSYGCAVDDANSLSNVDRFYVVAPNSQVPEGTIVFARLYQDGVAIEDLPEITAHQDYRDTCVNFVFEKTDENDFEAGDYEVEFFINGYSYNSISFRINE